MLAGGNRNERNSSWSRSQNQVEFPRKYCTKFELYNKFFISNRSILTTFWDSSFFGFLFFMHFYHLHFHRILGRIIFIFLVTGKFQPFSGPRHQWKPKRKKQQIFHFSSRTSSEESTSLKHGELRPQNEQHGTKRRKHQLKVIFGIGRTTAARPKRATRNF